MVRTVDGTAASLDSRVCGSWVTLLPEIGARSLVYPDVLQFAIKSLGYSILRKTPQALEAYGETLRLLKSSLAMAREVSFEEILAIILCLTLAEVWQLPPMSIQKLNTFLNRSYSALSIMDGQRTLEVFPN